MFTEIFTLAGMAIGLIAIVGALAIVVWIVDRGVRAIFSKRKKK